MVYRQMPLQAQQPPSASPSVRGANQERNTLPVISDKKGIAWRRKLQRRPFWRADGQYRHRERTKISIAELRYSWELASAWAHSKKSAEPFSGPAPR
jgi:hypothetical protein